jgi:hypothetical protein
MMRLKSSLLALLIFGFVTISSELLTHAQEAGIENGEEQKLEKEQATDAPVPVDLQNDPGAQLVMEAQEDSGIKPVEKQSAKDSLEEYLNSKSGWSTGWDEEKKRYLSIQAASFNTEDPVSDTDFCVKREMFVKRAILAAKAEIIFYINSTMSAREKLDVPGTDIHAQFSRDYDAAQSRLRSQQAVIAKLLAEYDEAEAEALEGATLDDRLKVLMDAAIKKLDPEYSTDQIEAKKKERFEKAKARYVEALAAIERIEAEVAKVKGQEVGSMTSEISRIASRPLIGATLVAQTESWNPEEETYEVGVLLCWSPKLEQAALASLTGEPVVGAKPGKSGLTVQQWLKMQDLSQMVGPRQFIDKDGQRWFLGISTRPTLKNSVADERNQILAEEFAAQMAAFSLYSDVDASSKATQVMKQYSTEDLNKSETKVAESLERAISQSFENLQISGMTVMSGKTGTVTHPLTGQKMHVRIQALSPSSARSAMDTERRTILAGIKLNKSQSFGKARTEELNAALKNSKNDSKAADAGRNQGKKELAEAMAEKDKPDSQPGKKETAEKNDPQRKTKAGATKVKEQGGDPLDDDE